MDHSPTLSPAAIAKNAGSQFEYRYRELPNFDDGALIRYIGTTRRLFAPIANGFEDTANTEWFVRSYLALKFVLAATLQANSARFAIERNLQVVRPYLVYYAMLSCCRAFLFTLPCLEWRGMRSIEEKHGTIIRTAADKLKRLDAGEAERCLRILDTARNQRNVISYRFPTSGLALFRDDLVSLDEAVRVARLFTELTQLNLACLEGSVGKLSGKTFKLLDLDDVWHAMRYETSTASLIDDDDYLRVGYFLKHYQKPVALIALATEGLVEEFFGAWHEELADAFDPDKDDGLLLDLL